MKLLINFMPLAHRSIQADGLTIFYIRYWNPVFVVWREQRQRVRVRYHPEDLSRIFVSADGRNYVQANYADLRRPRITLWEQRAAVRALRAAHVPRVSEEHVFRAIGSQRQIVEQAERSARRARRNSKAPPAAPSTELQTRDSGQPTEVDYSKPVTPYAVEIWK
jgi:putative transposase